MYWKKSEKKTLEKVIIFIKNSLITFSLVRVVKKASVKPPLLSERIGEVIFSEGREQLYTGWWKRKKFTILTGFPVLYYCKRNFCNLIGLEQWYFS